MLDDFIKYLENQYKNKSIYVLGAQGQKYPELTDRWIMEHAPTKLKGEQACKLYNARVKEGYREKMRAFDCSGLGMYWLYNVQHIFKGDMTANGMMGKCTPISKSQLKKGDWVFRVKEGRAYHIGYVVDEKKQVIEAKSHADGVVKRAINASGSSYWNAFGRPTIFKKEIEEEEEEMKILVKIAKGKISPIYNSAGEKEKGRYIAKGDKCQITNVMTDNLLIKVQYPTKLGTHIGYIKDLSKF